MRTPMVYPIRFWALVLAGLLLYQFSAEAFAENCAFEKNIEKTLDVSTSEQIVIHAAAGDLDVVGVAGTDRAVIQGRVCVSKQEWLEQSGVNTTTGKRLEINVYLPKTDGGWSSRGNNYVWLDLKIEVPEDLIVEIEDSSGDMLLKNILAARIRDSSGSIEMENVRGPVSIWDSSGDIDINVFEGNITIESDSSGDIIARDISGTVLVKKDSSGGIHVSQVSENVIVERDSSGIISVRDIGGDFRVIKDGSGGIKSENVVGEIQLPEKG